MKSAIAFDFDGTLIRIGKRNNDKAIHVVYATWVASDESGLQEFLRPARLKADVAQMTRAWARYPGAPRFQQFSAIANALVSRRYADVSAFEKLGIDKRYRKSYERARARFNELYSALNAAAAARYWAPFPGAKGVLRRLNKQHDLYIASGVTQDILQKDVVHHRFDRKLFQGIYGASAGGGEDKAEILRRIKRAGYDRMLFVGDSNRDWEYAQSAGAQFFRIREAADYPRLQSAAGQRLPRGKRWGFSLDELRFVKEKTLQLLERYCRGDAMTPAQITRWINRRLF